MQDEPTDPKSKRTRSPGYPSIDLEEALTRAAALWKEANRHSVPIDVASTYWGYDAKSSAGYSVASALLKFGLVTDEGTGEKRQLKLTESAIKLVYEPDVGDPSYTSELKDAALRPKIHAEIWDKYQGALPGDAVIRRFLVVERKFNDQYVDSFISQFRKTIEFAKLQASDKINGSQNEKAQTSKILGLSEAQSPVLKHISNVFGDAVGRSDQPTRKQVLARYSIPLGANVATIEFTGEQLSTEDFDALRDYVDLFKRQFERRLKSSSSVSSSSSESSSSESSV